MKFENMIKRLCKELREDPGYYISWQSNIAVAFQDEARRQGSRDSFHKLHSISNKAADNFLNLLMKE